MPTELQSATGPVAWMGYCSPVGTVKICAWCPDKAAADKIAKDSGLMVTHGMCVACFTKEQISLGLDTP